MWRSALVGAVAAIVLVAAVVLGGLYVVGGTAPTTEQVEPERVLLVFAAPNADGAVVAASIAVVADGRFTFVSPDTSVTIPGTSASTLGDAYIYGGGKAVSGAISGVGEFAHDGYVVVPQSLWARAAADVGGVSADLPQDVSVFDGERLTTLRSGEQTLTAEGVAAVLGAMPYFAAGERDVLRESLGRQLAKALAGRAADASELQSDLTPESLELWLRNGLAEAVAARP